jgi:site-specific recombinase XerD
MFSSLNYEKKYLKYKNKYQILKNQIGNTKNILNGGAKGTLNGGDCNPLPDPEEYDIISGENLFNLSPYKRITIQNKCYDINSLYKWIIEQNKNILPSTQTNITLEERQRLIEAYQRLNDCNPLPGPREEDIITGENLLNLHPFERISIQNRCYAVKGLYQWMIIGNHDRLPVTQTLLTPEERQRLIQAYQRLYDCNPLPDPEEFDFLYMDSLLNLNPHERISIQKQCYSVRSLYEWIIIRNNDRLPATQTIITPEERQRLIQAYNALP